MANIGMNLNYFERPKLPANEGSLGGEKYINNRHIRAEFTEYLTAEASCSCEKFGRRDIQIIALYWAEFNESITGRYT